MKYSTFVIKRKILIEYHLLGFLIIIGYLTLGLPAEIFWHVFSALGACGFSMMVAEFALHSKRPAWRNTCSIIKNQRVQFGFDLCGYLFLAWIMLLMNRYFPSVALVFVEKSAVAIIGVGFYIATGIALEAEYNAIQSKLPSPSYAVKILPAGQKSRYFLLLILTLDWIVFALLYFDYINSPHYQSRAVQSVQEILFVSVVVVSLSIYLFYLYNRNFTHILGMQIKALRNIEGGSFDVPVPVVSNDELALLANYHNSMIDKLRDREHLHKTLEKSVGANIMNKLLTTDAETLKQGESYNVAILFCDLRGFTSLGESSSAEEVILFLNDYFASVSSLISEHNGIINKFMGDAVLAIFGLDNDGNAVEDAVNASLAIVNNNIDLYMPNEMHPETGVGIDFGLVMGGTIGSENRYEYTIIGDAVNKASRLEGLSKRLGYSIILSEDAYKLLCHDLRKHFCDLGIHKVRGRNEAVTVYGCGKNQITDLD